MKFSYWCSADKNARVDIDDCSVKDSDARTYRSYGRTIERCVGRVMAFYRDFVGIGKGGLGVATGFAGCPSSASYVDAKDLELYLVGFFTVIMFSSERTYHEENANGYDLANIIGEVVMTAGQYGDFHLCILQPKEGKMEKCQSLDIVPVCDDRDAKLGARLREAFKGARKPSILASAF